MPLFGQKSLILLYFRQDVNDNKFQYVSYDSFSLQEELEAIVELNFQMIHLPINYRMESPINYGNAPIEEI